MKIKRKRLWQYGQLHSVIKLELTNDEKSRLMKAKLLDVKIHMSDGSLFGKTISIPNMTRAFEVNVRKVRDRWSVAMVRTSGSVFLDSITLYAKIFVYIAQLIFRFFFGTRNTVRSLSRGIRVSSKYVEDVKEAETFILISVAAIFRALDFAENATEVETLDHDGILRELAGLSFSGAPKISAAQGHSQLSDIDFDDDEGADDDDDDEMEDEVDQDVDIGY